jgi:AraC-like DNA-binding protein
MLQVRTVMSADGIELTDVACRHRAGPGSEVEHAGGHALVLVRRGCFVRRVGDTVSVLDPTVAYFMAAGDAQRFDHPHDHGDDCTSIGVDAELMRTLWGEPVPAAPLRVSRALDLSHRLLLADARRGEDTARIVERAILLVAAALAAVDPDPLERGRPRSAAARRALADGAREALAHDCSLPLPRLARELAVSPHHLSRVFAEVTGATISRHRMRLRARAALERLAGGERDLAGLAAELGFADQSHMCRVVRDEVGSTPVALRRSLAGA